MSEALASIDGRIGPLEEAVLPVTDPAFRLGWTVFETARVSQGRLADLGRHLRRLEASADAACVPLPDRDVLARQAEALAAAYGGLGRLRITVTGAGRCVMTVEPVSTERWGAPVHAVRGPHIDEPFLGGAVKHGSRAPWVVAVKRSGVDDVLFVDGEGRFTEGTTCGIVAVVDGTVRTAPHDGRVLASTTVTAVVDAARGLGVAVAWEAPSASGPWEGLYVASATRGLAPVATLDGVALPGWEPVGRALMHALGG